VSSTRTLPAFLAGLALASIVALFAFKASAKMPDFEVYWRAGVRAAAAQPLYRAEDEHYQLKYLPAFAVLAIPVSRLPLTTAKAVWFGFSVLLIPMTLALSLGLLPARQRTGTVLVIATLLVMAKFYGHELVLGQVNLLLLAVLVTAVHFATGSQQKAAGLLVALAIVIKPYAVIVLPWLAAIGSFTTLVVAVAGIAAALLLPAMFYGVGGTIALHTAWWRTVSESTAPNLLNPDNVSVAAMYAKWLGMGPRATILAIVTALALLAVVAAVVMVRRRTPSPAGLEAGLLLTLMPLLSPQGWDYVFLLATPAVMYLVNYDRELPVVVRILTWVALAIVGLSVYDVMGRRAYGRFMSWSAISVCFLVVIGALVTLRVKRVA
jgi:hypothetical protein